MSMREEFEVWYEKAYPGGLSTGVMGLAFKELAYEAWQASREALEIELPEEFGEDRLVSKAERHARSEAISECRAAIEAAGMKVKP